MPIAWTPAGKIVSALKKAPALLPSASDFSVSKTLRSVLLMSMDTFRSLDSLTISFEKSSDSNLVVVSCAK
eukprot:14789812-Heterocapsa_arctica.AAC.1